MRPIPMEFGPWLPDLPALGNPGVVEALNCLPAARGYKPLATLSPFSPAMNALVRGGVAAKDEDGNAYAFAGTTSKLYQLSATAATDVTRSSGGNYACADDSYWEFAQWGPSQLIATNFDDVIQAITLGGANFAALSGTPPQARHLGVVRQFLVTGNTFDGVDGNQPQRVRWSAQDDNTGWTTGTDQSDFQDLLGPGGWVQRIIGGEYGVVFREHSIYRMTYEGPPTIFRFDEVEGNRGTPCPGSVVPVGAMIFYTGQNGLYVFDGTQSRPIGNQRVDKTFFSRLNLDFAHRVSAAADPINKVVVWAYPSVESNGTPDRLLIYDWGDDKWSEAELDTERVFSALTAGVTLEDLDSISSSLDDLIPSLDSRAWTGGELLLAGVDTDHKMALFTGSAMTAKITTGEVQVVPGGMARLSAARAQANGTHTLAVGARALQTATPVFGAEHSPNSQTGAFDLRTTARYHRLRMTLSGAWTEAMGLDVEAMVAGRR